MIKAIIVDDEINAIKSLAWEIETFCEGIEVSETFTDPLEAISAINFLKPDCVFLDIEMPKMDGFQLLNKLIYKDFDLIITTAYDNYAIKAFKESAIDYLLKPVDSDDLIKSVSKVKSNKTKNSLGKELQEVLQTYTAKTAQKKIAIPYVGKTVFVKPKDIIYCKAEGNYTTIYFKGNEKEMISKNIKEVEKIINNHNFFRTHNSYLVNTQHIKEFIKKDGDYLILKNNDNIPVSRTKKDELLLLLNN